MKKHTHTLIKEPSRSDRQTYAHTDANSNVNVNVIEMIFERLENDTHNIFVPNECCLDFAVRSNLNSIIFMFILYCGCIMYNYIHACLYVYGMCLLVCLRLLEEIFEGKTTNSSLLF